MSDHSCPRRYPSEHGIGLMVYDGSKNCWICDTVTRAKYAAWMPMLPSLYAWLEDGQDLTSDEWSALYERFYESMDYGTQTGDTGTIDEWLCDRPDYIEDLIANIEGWCIFDAA